MARRQRLQQGQRIRERHRLQQQRAGEVALEDPDARQRSQQEPPQHAKLAEPAQQQEAV